ncbi:hypothetical protein DCAR_0313874 [Daucus carota subsp. sativus]|uniref:NB-ARC domain-containing protein n=1 Tax=Daucus carota subsp. sativus TaxID=79200 RepID=A0AAF0WU76_DAUCS|nr:PREDICTED: putative disease resistance protein At1g59780 [Daucus carota subsp. sativus]WOG94578.1 hypothetical protein DCAR_0313874 [Daucus carota subsp. sativus]
MAVAFSFLNSCTDESGDQEVGTSVFRERITINFQLLEVRRELLRAEQSLKLCLKNTDIQFLESVVGPGLDSQLQWIILKLRITSSMLEAAIEKTNSGSASEVETRKLESLCNSLLEIIRLIDEDITGNLISEEIVEYSSPTEVRAYARRFSGKISSVEAQINGLHDWTTTLGLTSAGCGQTMCLADNRFIVEAGTGHEKKDADTVGLEEDVQVITNKLISGETAPALVAITGGKGIGKTTLARKIYHNPEVAHHFPCRAWVTLPLDFEPNSFLFSIAKQVLIGFAENDSIKKIKYKLSRLWCFQRYLIVLDDAHAIEEATKALQELCSNQSNGSKLLITTTKRDLVKASPCCYIHERRVLGDEEAWELFTARLLFKVNQEVEQLAREVTKKCSGRPSSVLKLADFMSSKASTQEQWFVKLSQMNEPHASHYLSLSSSSDLMSSSNRQCLNVPHASHYLSLASSFDLMSSSNKQCLLYFILFPHNEIPARRLIVLWVAEGLVDQPPQSAETPESAGEKILNELVQNCMIQVAKWKSNGKVKTCRLDYSLMDTLLLEAGKASFLKSNLQVTASKSSSKKGPILRVADHLDNNSSIFSHIHENDSIGSSSFKQQYKKLISFISFDSREGPVPGQDIGNFINRGTNLNCFQMICVVDLEGTFRPKLPDSIKKLSQLRYLGLRRTYTELLPASIGKLLNLQTLDLKHTCLRSLPGSIWKLQQLRHLYLSESYRSRIMAPGSSSSLLDIQTLWGAFVDEETQIEDGLNRLTNLRKLGLVYRLPVKEQGILADWISKLHHLESLRLRSIDDMNNPSLLYLTTISGLGKLSSLYLLGTLANPFVLETFPESLTEITLSLSGIFFDPMRVLEKLPNLRILNLYAGSYTKKTMVCSSGGFPLLRVLNLWKLEELEEWIVKDGSLVILRHLEIRSCLKLKMIPEGLKHLEHCRELKLTNMPDNFKARITKDEGVDWQNVAHIASVIIRN